MFIDEDLNLDAKAWIDEYSNPIDLHENAYINLVSLSDNLDYEGAASLYQSTISKVVRGSIPEGEKLTYPKVQSLESIKQNELLCELKSVDCLTVIRNNKVQAKELINQFSDLLSKYQKIANLTNFTPLHSEFTEPNYEQLNTLSKLAVLDVYVHVLDNKYLEAVEKIKRLIQVDRKFMASSTDAFFEVFPIVRFENSYVPIISLIAEKDKKALSTLLPVLTPLTDSEFTMNRVFISAFAYGAEKFRLENIAHERIKESPIFGKWIAQERYKQNMTINDAFIGASFLVVPFDIPKDKILSFIDEQLEKQHLAHEKLKESYENSIKYFRNPAGSFMISIGPPRSVNLYPDKMEMDIRMLLLNIAIASDGESLEALMKRGEYVNPYNNKMPLLEGNSMVCYAWDNDICLSI